MKLTTGSRWRSSACTTEGIVVRIDAGDDVDLRCGGHPMLAAGADGEQQAIIAEFAGGSLLGKRYELEELGLELLVTKAGDGSLAVGETSLVEKSARRLPTSD